MEDFGNTITRIGLIADTHVPDRSRELHTNLFQILSDLKPDLILHAGDICSIKVIEQLRQIAPLRAVRGNRDLFGLSEYDFTYLMKANGVTIGLTHGHGNFYKYLLDKVKYILRGPQAFAIARRRALEMFQPYPDVLVYGHNHNPEIIQVNDTLVINPGSTCCPIPRNLPPSIGLLTLEDGKIEPRIIPLE